MKYSLLIILSLIFLLGGCSSVIPFYSEISGVERVSKEAKSTSQNGMPNFYLTQYKDTSRKIASIIEPDEVSDEDVKRAQLNNRQVYFLALYSQYNQFNKLLKRSNEVIVCPQFHNDLINYEKATKAQKAKLATNYQAVATNEKLIGVYPELALPVNDHNGNVYQQMRSENNFTSTKVVVEALIHHQVKIESEILNMCDKGDSDNFYVYENLVTHFKNNKKFISSNDGLKALLKVPVFANMLIVRSLSGNTANFGKQFLAFENEVVDRMNAYPFKSYLYNITQVRNNISKPQIKSAMRE